MENQFYVACLLCENGTWKINLCCMSFTFKQYIKNQLYVACHLRENLHYDAYDLHIYKWHKTYSKIMKNPGEDLLLSQLVPSYPRTH